jgi:VanZ family protein
MSRSPTVALAATLVIAACVGVLTLLPLKVPVTVPGTDKLHHLAAFAALTFPMALLVPRWLPGTVFLAVLYGGVIEIIQPYTGRYGDVMDWIADIQGVALGALVGLALNRLIAMRRR